VDGARSLCPPGRPSELFDRALTNTPESRGIVAFDGNGAAAGLVIFGLVAGAIDTGAIYWLAVRPDRRRHGIARALLALARSELEAEHARIAIAELPEEPGTAAMAKMLAASGFEREGVVPDFYRDGVALTLWRRSLS
jgi:ribosomal protein S18 acetylase RimI-like enzyme